MDTPDETVVPEPDTVNQILDAPEVADAETTGSAGSSRFARTFGRTLLVLLALVAGVYLAGVALFSFLFFPRTHIGPADVSLMTRPVAAETLAAATGNYSLHVTGYDADFHVPASDIVLDPVPGKTIANAHAKMNVLRWPLELTKIHRLGSAASVAYDESAVQAAVSRGLADVNSRAAAPVDAFVEFDEGEGAFVIRPEERGRRLDRQAVVDAIAAGLSDLSPEAILGDAHLVLPEVTKDDPRLTELAQEANGLLGAKIVLRLDGEAAYEADSSELQGFIHADRDQGVRFDEAGLREWAERIEASLNTAGKERVYTRADGKEVTVSRGTYGWKTKTGDVAERLIAAVHAGESVDIDIEVVQSAERFDPVAGVDWGRYIDVDLSEQHARFYDDAGTLIWESPIVTGRPRMATPTGIWKMNPKLRNVTLVGRIMPETGEPEYRTPVAYWMPFVGSSIGFHDATWQPRFGGQLFKQGRGSHGCVNLPLNAAKNLYPLVEGDEAVIVHW